jgi:hypothetical protein
MLELDDAAQLANHFRHFQCFIHLKTVKLVISLMNCFQFDLQVDLIFENLQTSNHTSAENPQISITTSKLFNHLKIADKNQRFSVNITPLMNESYPKSHSDLVVNSKNQIFNLRIPTHETNDTSSQGLESRTLHLPSSLHQLSTPGFVSMHDNTQTQSHNDGRQEAIGD